MKQTHEGNKKMYNSFILVCKVNRHFIFLIINYTMNDFFKKNTSIF